MTDVGEEGKIPELKTSALRLLTLQQGELAKSSDSKSNSQQWGEVTAKVCVRHTWKSEAGARAGNS